jgi:hypothetical protein
LPVDEYLAGDGEEELVVVEEDRPPLMLLALNALEGMTWEDLQERVSGQDRLIFQAIDFL